MKQTRMMIFGAMFAVATGTGALLMTSEPAYACSGGGGGSSSDYSWFFSWSN